MTEFDTWYESVWDALVSKVKEVDKFSDENVFYGEKFPPTIFPAAFVCPSEVTSVPATFRESYWNPSFEIGVVTENDDTKAGMLDAWGLAWKIAQKLTGTQIGRTLDGVVQNLEVVRLVPYWRGLGKGIEQHWVGVIVVCERQM